MLSFDQCRRSIAPAITGSDDPTEQISTFVDRLIQPTAQKQTAFFGKGILTMCFRYGTQV